MLIGYMRVSKADCSQVLDLQRGALLGAGIPDDRLYEDQASGKRDDRHRLEACLKVLAGQGANLDTTTANGRLVFGIFATLAEFERELIVERTRTRTRTGLASARTRGRNGGRPFKVTTAKLRLAQAAMGQPGTEVGELCIELGISRQTSYRPVDPNGGLRPAGKKLLGRKEGALAPDGVPA